jgi:hypothetical protein
MYNIRRRGGFVRVQEIRSCPQDLGSFLLDAVQMLH